MKPITRILLIRHGETDWNRGGRVMGTLPIPLNERGERQAQRLASVLRSGSVHAIYSSPVLRARQTATILAEALLRPLHIEPALTEIGMGEWEGQYWNDLAHDVTRLNLYSMPDEARPPGGETLREVQARCVSAIEQSRDPRDSTTLLFVTHADVVRAIVAHYLHFDLRRIRQVRIDHASQTALELGEGLTDLLYLNVVPPSGPIDD